MYRSSFPIYFTIISLLGDLLVISPFTCEDLCIYFIVSKKSSRHQVKTSQAYDCSLCLTISVSCMSKPLDRTMIAKMTLDVAPVSYCRWAYTRGKDQGLEVSLISCRFDSILARHSSDRIATIPCTHSP